MIQIILIIRMDMGRQTWSISQQDLRINIYGREVTVLWLEAVKCLNSKISLPLWLLCFPQCVKIDGETLLEKLLSKAFRGSAWIFSKFKRHVSNGNQQGSSFNRADNMAAVNEDDAIIHVDTDDLSHDQTSMMTTVSNNIRLY